MITVDIADVYKLRLLAEYLDTIHHNDADDEVQVWLRDLADRIQGQL